MFDLNGPSAKLIELHQIRLFIRFHSDLKIRKSIVSCVRVFINDDHWRVTVRTYNVYTYVTRWLYQQMVGIWVNRTTFTTNIKRIYLLIHMAIDMFDRVQCEKMQNLNHLIQSCEFNSSHSIHEFNFNTESKGEKHFCELLWTVYSCCWCVDSLLFVSILLYDFVHF